MVNNNANNPLNMFGLCPNVVSCGLTAVSDSISRSEHRRFAEKQVPDSPEGLYDQLTVESAEDASISAVLIEGGRVLDDLASPMADIQVPPAARCLGCPLTAMQVEIAREVLDAGLPGLPPAPDFPPEA